MQKLKAILVDPFSATLSHVEIEPGLEGLYDTLACECVHAISLGAGLTLWIDDEGLLKDDQKFFEVRCYEQPIAGRALILSDGPDGETISVDPRLTLEHVKKVFSFVELEDYPQPKIEFYSF